MEELLQELAEAELGRQVMETAGVAGGKRSEVTTGYQTANTAAWQALLLHTQTHTALTLLHGRTGLQEGVAEELVCEEQSRRQLEMSRTSEQRLDCGCCACCAH